MIFCGMLPIHFYLEWHMSEHTTVTQLKQWLENQRNPMITRADKTVNWCAKNIPGFKKVVSSKIFRNGMLISPLPILLIPFLQYLPNNLALVLTFFSIFLMMPILISWCTNINWQNACDTLKLSTPSDLDRIREKLQRIQVYHPELHPIIQQTFDALNVRSSKFSADQLETILKDILLELPISVNCENSSDSQPSFNRASSGLKV